MKAALSRSDVVAPGRELIAAFLERADNEGGLLPFLEKRLDGFDEAVSGMRASLDEMYTRMRGSDYGDLAPPVPSVTFMTGEQAACAASAAEAVVGGLTGHFLAAMAGAAGTFYHCS